MRLFQSPPGRLQILVLERHVGIFPVQPGPQDLELSRHVVLLAQRELLAPLYELIYAISLDILLA